MEQLRISTDIWWNYKVGPLVISWFITPTNQLVVSSINPNVNEVMCINFVLSSSPMFALPSSS